MRIAEVIATFPPYHGGMGYVCYHNARELARRGHDVSVFTLDYGRADYGQDPNDIRIVRLRAPLTFGDGGPVPQLYAKLKEFDIIHLHYPFFGGAEYVYAASLLRGQRYFLTYHLDVFGTTLFRRMIVGAYEMTFMKKILKRASLIGALSMEHLKSSKVAPMIDWDRVVELPNGVDTDRFQPREKDRTLLKRYGLEDSIIVLFVGNLQPFKGLDILINAIAQIQDERIVLLVVGSGYGEREYRKQTEEQKLAERVIFAGPKSPDEDLPAYYNLCDFLVLPSTHSEAYPLVVLEAMASGKPVIVSSLPGPSQLVRKDTDGLVVSAGAVKELKNTIEFLASHSDLRMTMGKRAREKMKERFSWRDRGEQLENILLNIIHNN